MSQSAIRYFCCFCLFVCLSIFFAQAQAQTQTQTLLRYNFSQAIPVYSLDNQPIPLAWAGGFNSPQFSTIDLNGDAKPDLFVFDRTANRVFTFLNQNNAYVYAPAYEILFPAMRNWCLLVDYDKDGKKDIFTFGSSFGVAVYRNISVQGGNVSFVPNPKVLQVKSISGNFLINLSVDATDIPAIDDIDNDGDVDMLFFTPQVGAYVEFAKNMSIEKYKNADSLEFEKANTKWGDFEECSRCNEFKFGSQNCMEAQKKDEDGEQSKKNIANNSQNLRTERTEHSGSTQLLIDLDGNGQKDMLLGDVSCNNLVAFFNKGTSSEAKFDTFVPTFPQNSPANLYVFPAAYYEDLDFDGVKDLIVALNRQGSVLAEPEQSNFRQSVWFYKNKGTTAKPDFVLQQKDFLQNQMLDLGEKVKPTTIDLDADGDLDLLLANGASLQADNSFKAQVFYYENTGTNQNPLFRLRNENLYNFLNINILHLRIAFADLNNDKAIDLVFGSANSQNVASLQYVLNENAANQPLQFDLNKRQRLNIATNIRPFDEPHFADINNDNQPDLLLGRLLGNLEYWENTGNITFTLRNVNAGGLVAGNTNNLSLATADLTNDGKLELVTGDASGNVRIYENFAENINTTFKEISPFIQHEISGLRINHNFGQEVCPAFVGKDLVLGTNTGGVHYLRFGETITSLADDILQIPDFQVFPNPTTQNLFFKSPENVQISLHTILGQATNLEANVEAQKLFVWDLQHLPTGLYLLKIKMQNGRTEVRKIVKESF
jgi:hypothetical protein